MADVERLSVTEASRRGVARLVGDAAHGTEVVVERHGTPVAAVVATSATPSWRSCAPTCVTWPWCSGAGPTTTARRHALDDVVDAFGRARRELTVSTVALTEPALDDLRRAGPVAAALLLGRLRVLEQDPEAGAPLVDRRAGFRVLDALDGDARVVYGRDGEHVTVFAVWVDGVRSDGEIYAEALERVRAADPSEQVALARSVQRLARLTGVRPVPSDRLRAPVPDWLADALVRDAGPDAPRRGRDGRGHGVRRVEHRRGPQKVATCFRCETDRYLLAVLRFVRTGARRTT